MNNFLDSLLLILLGVCIGFVVGVIVLGILMDKNYQKFCPQCGDRFRNEEIYCIHDGTELLMIER